MKSDIDFDAERTRLLALGSVQMHTVYHIVLRLRGEGYLMQYDNMKHQSTLKLTDRVMRQARMVMRHQFGEFFFRVVVFEYFEDSRDRSTVVSMAVLLDRNQYNLIDTDSVFSGCADRGFFGNWHFTPDDYIVNGIHLG